MRIAATRPSQSRPPRRCSPRAAPPGERAPRAPPDSSPKARNVDARPVTLIIACGALAREIAALRRANGWTALEVRCLPAELHNRPERIAPAVRELIAETRGQYAQTFVAYGDCGTRGELDRVLREEGVERLPGAHCYEFFATAGVFAQLADNEP